MPYRKKASAPYVIDLGGALLGTVLGTPGEWLGALVPTLGQDFVDVSQMCAAGPPQDVDPQLSDLLSFTNPVSGWMGFQKMERMAKAQVFPRYCEAYQDPTPVCTPLGIYVAAADGSLVAHLALPAGSETVQMRKLGGGGDSGHADIYEYSTASYLDTLGGGVGFHDTASPGTWHSFTLANNAVNVSVNAWPAGQAYEFQACGPQPAPPDPVAPPAVQPPGTVLPPTTTGSTDIAGLARDLAAIQTQLSQLQHQLLDTEEILFIPGTADLAAAPEPASGDQVVPLTGGRGVLVIVSNIPAWRSLLVADPPLYPRLGWAAFKRAEGYWPPMDLRESRTVLSPPPTGATDVSVHVDPPLQAQVVQLKGAGAP